ncbi:MAG: single-stranded DNA-binding protein [Sarcina sp.]
MNKVILLGRLTRDPDLRFAQGSGKAVTRFTIAVTRPMKRDESDFISCIAFNKAGETIAQYLTKGSQIAITGNIRTGSYEKDGQVRYTTDVIVDTFEFVSGDKKNTNNSNNNFNAAHQQFNQNNDDMMPIDDGDIPF